MSNNKVEKIAYFFGWFLLGPLNLSLEHVKKKLKKRSLGSVSSGQRLIIANFAGLVSLLLKLDGGPTKKSISRASQLVCKAFRLDENSTSPIESLFEEFLGSSLSFDGLVATLPNLLGDDQKNRNQLFELLVYIVDNVSGLKWEKKLLLLKVADSLNVPLGARKILLGGGHSRATDKRGFNRRNFYLQFFGLHVDCDREQIHRQYRRIVKTIHPDLYPDVPMDVKKARMTAMQELNRLYQYLINS